MTAWLVSSTLVLVAITLTGCNGESTTEELETPSPMISETEQDTFIENNKEIIVDIDEDEHLPAIDEFVVCEFLPEMIHYVNPEYPRLAKAAGLGGVVWINALVDKNGVVRDARIAKSSGTPSIDEAALVAARQNRFNPAIQNGYPIACWAKFKVEFIPEYQTELSRVKRDVKID